MVIAQKGFRDEELFDTKAELEKAGIMTVIASKEKGACEGMFGRGAEAQLSLGEVSIDSYNAVVFVGGVGASQYYRDPEALGLIGRADRKGKIIAAICIAPVIVANTGIMQGKKVTAYPSVQYDLQKKGAKYTGEPVEMDGNIITGNGPEAAKAFGQAIAKAVGRM